MWNWNFKLLYWFFNLYSFLLAVGCCSNFKQEFWSAVVSLKEKWLQAANICKQRHFGHIFASLLYESCLKGKANNLARLDKFEFVGLVKVICKPVVQFFRSIFYMKQMLRFYPIGWQTRVYVNLTVITFARPPHVRCSYFPSLQMLWSCIIAPIFTWELCGIYSAMLIVNNSVL